MSRSDQSVTVAQYIVKRMSVLGIDKAFGVPGDYLFPILEAIQSNTEIDWIGCSNELNAAYAADGYARSRGAAILSVTYGVGELSTVNGLMACMAERVPVFAIIGSPSRRLTKSRLIGKHTLGDGVYGNFEPIMQAVSCVHAFITPENAVSELERVIREAFFQSRPAYIVVPHDVQLMPILETPIQGKPFLQTERFASVAKELDRALSLILDLLANSKNPVILPSMIVSRFGLVDKLREFIEKANIPFALTPISKAMLDETHHLYMGLYNGVSSSPQSVKSWVEQADLILDIGGLVAEDLNTGFWTEALPADKVVRMDSNSVTVGSKTFLNVFLEDILDGLLSQTPKFSGLSVDIDDGILPLVGLQNDPINSQVFYPRFQRFLKENDVLVSDAGTCQVYINPMRLPKGVRCEHIELWSSIGWATPATLGIALAHPEKRVVCVTGDGAHQMTLNELATMGFYGLKPIIFVQNNNLYGCEITLSRKGDEYNNLPHIEFHRLPEAFGCKGWLTKKVETVQELDDVLSLLQGWDAGAYIEVVMPQDEFQPLSKEILDYMYKLNTP